MKQGELAELVVLDKSKQIFESICKFVPGGVHSNVRCIDPHPIYFSRAKGSRIWDVDGNEYTDYCVNYGTCILGHAHPRVVSAVREQLEIGLTCGVETELAAKVAKKVEETF